MKTITPNSETKLCLSLAAHPGIFGSRFHNYLFRALDLDFIYLSRKITDLPSAIQALRALGICGCAVTMPFKIQSVALVDEVDETVGKIGALNTIINSGGRLMGYNTDYWAIESILQDSGLSKGASVEVLGSGGIASAVVMALADQGFTNSYVRSRSMESGRALAGKFGLQWQAWDSKIAKADVLINATSLGFKEPPAFAFPLPDERLKACALVIDVVANPLETSLVRRARELGVKVVGGPEVSKRQALRQFQLYTGINPSAEMVEKAAREAMS